MAVAGQSEPYIVVTNADGNEASAMANINQILKVRPPVEDALHSQTPTSQIYEPLNEGACAGLAAGCQSPLAAASGVPVAHWISLLEA